MKPWNPFDEKRGPQTVVVGGAVLQAGSRVRLRPHGGADIIDLALKGKQATIESIERDFEDRIYIAVTVDEDPGRDIGKQLQPGHRFFFHADEIEPLGDHAEAN